MPSVAFYRRLSGQAIPFPVNYFCSIRLLGLVLAVVVSVVERRKAVLIADVANIN